MAAPVTVGADGVRAARRVPPDRNRPILLVFSPRAGRPLALAAHGPAAGPPLGAERLPLGVGAACLAMRGLIHLAPPLRPLALVVFVLASCGPGEADPPPDGFVDDLPTFEGPPGALVRAHAHNDYEHERPLLDALEQRFYSVEADVYLQGGQIITAHYPWENRGRLYELYLDPLQDLVEARGSVHGDDVPFTLWVDLKDGSDELLDQLHEELAARPIFTTFTDEEIRPGPVTVVLTGDADAKRRYVEERDVRFACRDSNDFSEGDPDADHRWRYYALSWGDHADWNGEGSLPADEETSLRTLTEGIHAKGRTFRFYAAPDTEAAWLTQVELGVDLVHTDDLAGLAEVLGRLGG